MFRSPLRQFTGKLHSVRYFAQPSSAEVYDVVVVGAGMVGSALTARLGSNPLTSELRVALVDNKVPEDKLSKALDVFPELRVSTLTPASVDLVKRTGAWESTKPPSSSARFSKMHVWDYASPGNLEWDSADVGYPDMGIVIENSLLQSALLGVAKSRRSVECLFGSQIQNIKFSSQSDATPGIPMAEVQLSDGSRLSTRLVVGADGAASSVRSMAGLRASFWDYDQRGLVATVRVDRPTETAWQRFLPTGPLALLPVRDGFCNVVWSAPPKMVKNLELADREAFVRALNESLQGSPPSSTQSEFIHGLRTAFGAPQQSPFPPDLPLVLEVVGDGVRSFPLRMMYTGRYVSPRLALVGDAAHVVHPLAGQGVNLGLGDVEQLALALTEAVECGCDIGDPTILKKKYEDPRKAANVGMAAALSGIKEFFEMQAGFIPAVRGFGMSLMNGISPVKNAVMKYAMGITV